VCTTSADDAGEKVLAIGSIEYKVWLRVWEIFVVCKGDRDILPECGIECYGECRDWCTVSVNSLILEPWGINYTV